jgi:hypothetical protein
VREKQHEKSVKIMKKDNMEKDDELRSEYNLKNLKVRKVGAGRKSFLGPTVRIENDVAEVFPDSESVNEALRFLIRITKENKSVLIGTSNNA